MKKVVFIALTAFSIASATGCKNDNNDRASTGTGMEGNGDAYPDSSGSQKRELSTGAESSTGGESSQGGAGN